MFTDRALVLSLNLDTASECTGRFSKLAQEIHNAKFAEGRRRNAADDANLKLIRKENRRRLRRDARSNNAVWHRKFKDGKPYWYNTITKAAEWELPQPTSTPPPRLPRSNLRILSLPLDPAGGEEEKRALVALIKKNPDGLNAYIAHSTDKTPVQKELLAQFNAHTNNHKPLTWLRLQLLDISREFNTVSAEALMQERLATLIREHGGLNAYIAHSADKTLKHKELLALFNTQERTQKDLRWLQSQLKKIALKAHSKVK